MPAHQAAQPLIGFTLGDNGDRGTIFVNRDINIAVEISNIQQFFEVVSRNIAFAIKLLNILRRFAHSFSWYPGDPLLGLPRFCATRPFLFFD